MGPTSTNIFQVSSTTTNLVVANLKEGETYRFAAVATDKYGVDSPFSPIISYTVPDGTPVGPGDNSAKPIDLQIAKEGENVVLSAQITQPPTNGYPANILIYSSQQLGEKAQWNLLKSIPYPRVFPSSINVTNVPSGPMTFYMGEAQ
jgi:hypothetical protein